MQEKDERVTLSKYQYAVQEKFRRAVQEFIWDNSKSKYDEKVYAQMIDIIVEEARKVGLKVGIDAEEESIYVSNTVAGSAERIKIWYNSEVNISLIVR